jgi:hypothetical protein
MQLAKTYFLVLKDRAVRQREVLKAGGTGEAIDIAAAGENGNRSRLAEILSIAFHLRGKGWGLT